MSEDNQQQVHFKQLTEDEKQSKLTQLARSTENKVTVWKKGQTKKYNLSPVQYFRSKSEIQVMGSIPDDHIDQEVLYSYELSGLHFFGKCTLTSPTKEKIYLNCKSELFKSERRANFRLLTYPHQKVFIHIEVPQNKDPESNVISFNTGTNETGLFKNFLNVIEEKEEETIIEGFIKLRVLDLSVTGLAILLGELENKLFTKINVDLGKMHLEFNGQILDIPNGKILYKLEQLASDKKTTIYKAGLQFLGIDTNLDEELSGLINQTLRSLESEFEDFLK